MIYTTETLGQLFAGYTNLSQKASLEHRKGNLVRVKRGLFTDDFLCDKKPLANLLYGPSYLSFEFALYWYGLIPERILSLTSATMKKHRSKEYAVSGTYFLYRDIPEAAFSCGTETLLTEKGESYRIARKEKALCDTLYAKYPVRSLESLEWLLYNDLRLEEEDLIELDVAFIQEIAPKYRSRTLSLFSHYLEELQNAYRNPDAHRVFLAKRSRRAHERY